MKIIACGLGILLKPASLLAFRAVKWHLPTTLSTVGVDIYEKGFKNGRLAGLGEKALAKWRSRPAAKPLPMRLAHCFGACLEACFEQI
jgi:hypothetical protein